MNLLISTVGVDSGLLWEQNLNASLTTLDGHNHALGSGVQITPAGLNINASLPFNNNPAISLQALTFLAQVAYTPTFSLYFSGLDLYANDGAGNAIPITSGGGLAASSSGISSPPASAGFISSVLVVNAAANTPANIQSGSILIGNNVLNSKYLTISPPSALASNYTITMPLAPAAASLVTMDSSGNLSTIPRAVNFINSSSCGTATISGTLANVTNLSVSITSTGRPVVLMLQGLPSSVSVMSSTTGSSGYLFETAFFNGTNTLGLTIYSNGATNNAAVQQDISRVYIDPVSAGTHTYTFQARAVSSGTNVIQNYILVAYELPG